MKIATLLSIFNLRKIELDLYQKLFYGGQMSATQLAKQSEISRTSVYDLLERLIEIGIVFETQKGGVKMFAACPPEKLHLLIEEKEKELKKAKIALDILQSEYLSQKTSSKPRMQIYEGKKELQQMMKDMLLFRDITVYAYWPVIKLNKLLSGEFLTSFHKERVKRNINIKVIWPQNEISSIKKYPYSKTGTESKRDAKIAPAEVDFSLGYAIYGNSVRFISSSKENFGFLVESAELAEMMKTQFDSIWKLSKPYK
ncbi:hypothetical protein KKA15_02530 [Patescibacteria group bacterium]|nr:hypothetical protein [Patescibacteria group bacterium]